jgi:hypothetical protein
MTDALSLEKALSNGEYFLSFHISQNIDPTQGYFFPRFLADSLSCLPLVQNVLYTLQKI